MIKTSKLKLCNLIIINLFSFSIFAQTDTVKIQEIEIKANRQPFTYYEKSRNITVIDKAEIEKIHANSVIDVLEYIGSMDVRQRGADGVQADISMRAGTFEQVLILLNGAKISDPQTGHHNFNLPIDIKDIKQIEILHGAGARIYGSNAYSGAINIITDTNPKRNANASLSVGDNNLINGNLSLNYNIKKFSNLISLSKNVCDGYIENTDYNLNNIFYQSSLDFENGKLLLQAGFNQKEFGANGFYVLKYPDEFEATKTKFGNLRFIYGKKLKVKSGLYFRRHHDRFELFRNEAPAWYTSHNYHQTDVIGADANLSFNSKLGTTMLGADYKLDKILSNKLGENSDTIEVKNEENAFFTKSAIRKNLSFFVDHKIQVKNFDLSTGVMSAWNSDYGFLFYPGIDLSYKISEKFRMFSSANKSLRLPTYTELYYVGAGLFGNINLKPENATTFEIGTKFNSKAFADKITVFETFGRNTIDWVKRADTTFFDATNIAEINTFGIELEGKILFQKLISEKFPINYINYSYTFLSQEKQNENYISKYALDYLKHKIFIGMDIDINEKLSITTNATFQKREGTYSDLIDFEVPYPSVILLDASINYKTEFVNVFASCSNILNSKYNDIGGIILPGRWFKIGISTSIPFAKK